ncbi:hypothetical protein [Pseudonocardia sp. N23]|uniref:hypothetical protein n=1 Tax=Pseudonocardia sp. N23 TaxID=1987376 RepID=UPI001145FAAF|nr:hypothetical protein [Pseudonocardia sp. N23]
MITGQVVAILGADWGTLSAQVSAWTGVAAFFVASIGGWFAFRSFKRQGEQLAELKQDKRAEQISKLGVWVTEWDTHYTVANDSNVPVHALSVWIQNGDSTANATSLLNFPPGKAKILPDSPMTTEGLGVVGYMCIDNAMVPWFRWGTLPIVEITREQFAAIGGKLGRSADFIGMDQDILRQIFPDRY